MNFQSRKSFGDSSIDITTDARVLFDAVRHGKNHLVRFILEASSVDIVNSRDLHGKTPLMQCCYTKEEGARDNTVRLLLSHGADVNLTDDSGRTVLSYVCERRCNDILRILIREHNIDPDIADKNGNTPLIYAAMVGNDIACDILIRHFRRLGLSIDSVNDEGFTALLIAAKHGNITCAQILLGQGKASLHYRDVKHGLSVEEWLATKDISIQDVTPIRNDGKGRTRFVRLANIAAICATKKHIQSPQQYDDLDYALKNFHVGRVDDNEGGYMSDATTETNISDPKYIARYHESDQEFCPKKSRNISLGIRPKLKTQATQTDGLNASGNDDDTNETHNLVSTIDHVSIHEKDVTALQSDAKPRVDSKQRKSTKKDTVSDFKKTNNDYLEIAYDYQKESNLKKRSSLPDMEHAHMASRNDIGSKSQSEIKKSLDVLPEKFIAQIDIGNGRTHNIQIHADSLRNKVYWNPIKRENQGNDADEDDLDDHKLSLPKKFERNAISMSDSETSTNDDGPIF